MIEDYESWDYCSNLPANGETLLCDHDSKYPDIS